MRNSLQSVAAASALPHVLSVTDPLTPASTSPDGRIAYSTVGFDAPPNSLGAEYIARVDAAVQPARAAGVQVSYGSSLGVAVFGAVANAVIAGRETDAAAVQAGGTAVFIGSLVAAVLLVISSALLPHVPIADDPSR